MPILWRLSVVPYFFQYNQEFLPKRLGNWEVAKWFPDRKARDPFNFQPTEPIVDDRGHFLPGAPRANRNPWNNYIGTHDQPPRITRAIGAAVWGVAWLVSTEHWALSDNPYRVRAVKKSTAGKKRTPISPVFEPRTAMWERILAQVFPLMKKMVLHDLMRVQITKISVYLFYPLYFFYPLWPYFTTQSVQKVRYTEEVQTFRAHFPSYKTSSRRGKVCISALISTQIFTKSFLNKFHSLFLFVTPRIALSLP